MTLVVAIENQLLPETLLASEDISPSVRFPGEVGTMSGSGNGSRASSVAGAVAGTVAGSGPAAELQEMQLQQIPMKRSLSFLYQ